MEDQNKNTKCPICHKPLTAYNISRVNESGSDPRKISIEYKCINCSGKKSNNEESKRRSDVEHESVYERNPFNDHENFSEDDWWHD